MAGLCEPSQGASARAAPSSCRTPQSACGRAGKTEGGRRRRRRPHTLASPQPAGLTWRCRPRKTTAKAPCPTRSLLLYSKSPTTSMAAPPGHTAGWRRPGSAPSARRSGRPPRAAGLGQPRPRPRADVHAEWTERKRERPLRGAGLKRGLARPWLLMARPAAGRGLAGERPRSCRASGAAAVTVRPRRRPRARERCGARSSPSPARLAASALSSWGAADAAAATAALGPAQLRSPRASRPQGSVQRTGARHPLPHRLPASGDVSTSCRMEHMTKHALSARKMRARTARGSARRRYAVAR